MCVAYTKRTQLHSSLKEGFGVVFLAVATECTTAPCEPFQDATKISLIIQRNQKPALKCFCLCFMALAHDTK